MSGPKFILSAMGNKMIAIDDYIFRKSRTYKEKSFWICNKDKSGCYCRLQVRDNTDPPEILKMQGEHTHWPDIGETEARIAINEMKQMAMDSDETIGQIYTDALTSRPLSDSAVLALPPGDALKRAIKRTRDKKEGKIKPKKKKLNPGESNILDACDSSISTNMPQNQIVHKEVSSDGTAIANTEEIYATLEKLIQEKYEDLGIPRIGTIHTRDSNFLSQSKPYYPYCSKVMSSMYRMQKDERYTDFFITLLPSKQNELTDSKIYGAHKVVLAAISPKIYKLGKRSIKIGGKVTCMGLERVIEYAYTGKLSEISKLGINEVLEIKAAALALNINILDYIKQHRPELELSSADDVVQNASKSPPKNGQTEKQTEMNVPRSRYRIKAFTQS